MKEQFAGGSARRPYQKPSVQVVDLVAEEVLAPGCKLPGPPGGGPLPPVCYQALGPKCINAGS